LVQLIENYSPLPSLFHRYPGKSEESDESKSINYMFAMDNNNRIKVKELKFREILKTNNYKNEYLSFTDLTQKFFGEYQLEKRSIAWKINIEERQIEIKIIRDEIDDLINLYRDRLNGFNHKLENLKDDIERTCEIENLVQFLGSNKLIINIEQSLEKLRYWNDDSAKIIIMWITVIEDLVKSLNEYKNYTDKIKSAQITSPQGLESFREKLSEFIKKLNKELNEKKEKKIEKELKNFFI